MLAPPRTSMLSRLGARPLPDQEFPGVRKMVQRLAGALEIPVPTLYIADDDALK